jgi:3' exoribonuclease, RNase T-like
MKDVMIDFETLGTSRNACIIQVGAVYFNNGTGELGEEYKANISPASHVRNGGVMDADTVCWWMNQSDEARASILKEGQDVLDVFANLNQFLEPAKRIWSHATFDFVILMETLKTLDMKPRFSYKAGLDIRTLIYLAGSKVNRTVREGVHHDALDDCKHQVKYCVSALNQVKTNKKLISAIDQILSD